MRDPVKILAVLGSQGYSFSFFTPADVTAHKTFVEKNWPGTITRSNYDYNKWKYGTRADGINLLLCKKDDRIIGQIGYIPATINIAGKVYDCVWGCNFKVEGDYKELGIGAALEIFASQHFPVILGNTPSKDSIKYKQALGYKFLDGPRILMFPVKTGHLLQLKGQSLPQAVLSAVSLLADPLLKIYNNVRFPPTRNSWQLSDEQGIAARIDTKERSLTIPHIVHDERFLQWRCNLPPDLRPKAKILAYTTDNSSYAIYSLTGRVLNIYDYFFANTGLLRSLMAHLLTVPGISTLRIQANSDEEEQMLHKYGFIPFRQKTVITAWSKDRLFDAFDKMYVTAYDGDMDI